MVRLKADDVHIRVENILGEIKIRKTAKMVFNLIFKNNINTTRLRKKSAEKTEQEIKLYEARIKTTEDKLADDQITSSTYNNIINRYKSNIVKLQTDLNTDKGNASEYTPFLKKGVDYISNLNTIYTNCEIQAKRKVMSSLFQKKAETRELMKRPC